MQWFRWYHGTTEDTKLRMVARNAGVTLRDVIAVWAMVMESASQGPGDGKLKFQNDYIAVNLGFSDEEIDQIWCAMEAVGVIKTDHFDTWVSNWNKRQYLSDRTDPTNAERQKRWRDKRAHNADNVTHNGVVTVEKRPDTDTDTDTEKKETREGSRSSFDRFWAVYPEKVGKGAAQNAFDRAIKVTDIDTLLAAVARYRAVKPADRQWCNPATWLNQKRWTDEPAPPPNGLRPAASPMAGRAAI